MPGKLINKPQNLRSGGTPRPGAIQRAPGPAKFTPPPMASVILAKFQSPKRPAAPSAAVPRNVAAPGRVPAVAGPGYIQQKPGPPPMASEILSRFNSGFNRSAAPGGPSVPGISGASGVGGNAVARNVPNMGSGHAAQGRGSLQAKPGLPVPPPMASEILAKLRGPATNGASVGLGAGSSQLARLAGSVQLKQPAGAQIQRAAGMTPSGAPPVFRPGPAGQAGGVKPSAFVQPQGRGAVQLFKLQLFKDGKPTEKGKLLDYGNNQKLDTQKIEGEKLVDVICEDTDFTGKEVHVLSRLKQYVSLYSSGKDLITFTMRELKLYLYDDIHRLQIPIDEKDDLLPQALLSSTQGIKRLASGKQTFPTDSEVKFYRSMNLVQFAKMLGVATVGKAMRALRTELPDENVNIKARITAPRELGNHVGDYKYSYGYFGNENEAQAFLEFTFNAKDFFKPENLALPETAKATSNTGFLKQVLKTTYAGKGEYAVSSANEGTNPDRPGIKSEGPKFYSVGLSAPAMEKFINSSISVSVLEYNIP